MYGVLFTFLTDALNAIIGELMDPLQSVFSDMFEISLKIEKMGGFWILTNSITADAIENIYSFMYATMCGLMALAFLYKGWMVYVVWRDGDSDVSPQALLIGAGAAIVVAIAFPYLYDILADVVLYIGNGIMDRFQTSNSTNFFSDLLLAVTGGGFIFLIMALIFFIILVILCCKILVRGVELLILRLGFPIACLGLINSDSGVFKQYTGILFKTAAMTIIQMACLLLGLSLMREASVVNAMVAVTLEIAGLSGPKILAQLIPSTGGNGMSKTLSTVWMLKQVLPFGH